ncbi:MAG TPA: hypothetical protein VLG50_00035 [Candidatus Saccharimonadales bacterium]|nr:hypothetical protein [Candidatus Saccharimonadales bacterium]
MNQINYSNCKNITYSIITMLLLSNQAGYASEWGAQYTPSCYETSKADFTSFTPSQMGALLNNQTDMLNGKNLSKKSAIKLYSNLKQLAQSLGISVAPLSTKSYFTDQGMQPASYGAFLSDITTKIFQKILTMGSITPKQKSMLWSSFQAATLLCNQG